MMVQEFLKQPGTMLDVRSPAEYAHAHIPGALNMPLFTDAERAAVGTTYKKKGKEQAIEQGLAFAGPKLSAFVQQARHIAPDGLIKLYCWRGGMRSSSMAWLLQTAGMKTCTLHAGYKAFRNWALPVIAANRMIVMLGGLTGSGKTAVLHALNDSGEQILDLEALACHQGSSYGMLNMPPQPSIEQFENAIAMQLSATDPLKPLWIEDESRMVGACKIPDALFKQMKAASLFFIERPKSERVQILLKYYGSIEKSALVQATARLEKKLGPERTCKAIALIIDGHFDEAVNLILHYYDSSYHYGLKKRSGEIHPVSGSGKSIEEWKDLLYEHIYDKRFPIDRLSEQLPDCLACGS